MEDRNDIDLTRTHGFPVRNASFATQVVMTVNSCGLLEGSTKIISKEPEYTRASRGLYRKPNIP